TLTQNVAVPFALPPVMLHQETFTDLLKVVIENIQDRERGGKYDQSELEKEDDTPSRRQLPSNICSPTMSGKEQLLSARQIAQEKSSEVSGVKTFNFPGQVLYADYKYLGGYEGHTLIKWSRIPIDAVLHDEAELIEQNENKDGLNKQNSLAGSLGGILNGYDGEEAGFGPRYVVKLEDMGFFIHCEVVPEKAPTEVNSMAGIINKDAQQQQQQVDDNKTKMPEIKPPQIVTLQPGSQTNKGFGTSSSQQRVTTTSGSVKIVQ
ncbi:MAG: hypothetical protein EZS28_041684, partial [Streblomastix strix]